MLNALLRTSVDARVRALAIASLVVQILIVATGGAVRLTGSGLGCPTWPRCTEESFVATPEMGIHGAIEFGNRLLTFVVAAVAILTFLSIVRMRRERRDLFVLALLIGLYVPIQAVIGGITVWTGLNPYIVGLHFVASVMLVGLAAMYVYRVHDGPAPTIPVHPAWYRGLAYVTSVLVAITILVGVLTTGSGPHAGDGGAARNGLDSELLQHVHSWPAYATFAATLLLLLAAPTGRLRLFSGILLLIELAQIVVGIVQSRTGLPEVLVGIHMVLACALAAAMVTVLLSLKRRNAVHPYATAPAAESAEVGSAN